MPSLCALSGVLPADFSYKAVIGGTAGGLLAFLRDPAWEFLSSKFKNKK